MAVASSLLMGFTSESYAEAVCSRDQWLNGGTCAACPTNARCAGNTFTCINGYTRSGNACVCAKGRYEEGGKCMTCPTVPKACLVQ